jgi:hypothetical protein
VTAAQVAAAVVATVSAYHNDTTPVHITPTVDIANPAVVDLVHDAAGTVGILSIFSGRSRCAFCRRRSRSFSD